MGYLKNKREERNGKRRTKNKLSNQNAAPIKPQSTRPIDRAYEIISDNVIRIHWDKAKKSAPINAEDMTELLDGEWNGSSGQACCPAHDDHNPSLSISEGDDGRCLVRCHANCSWDKLREALSAKYNVTHRKNLLAVSNTPNLVCHLKNILIAILLAI